MGGGGGDEEEQVMSEVHLGCPPDSSGPFVSHFTFPIPPTELHDQSEAEDRPSRNPSVDEDGDLVLARRNKSCHKSLLCKLTLQHNITSTLNSVGLQVWKAALVLVDFVLHKSFTSPDFNGISALELGAGTGLVGVVLARVAGTIFLTDRGIDVLDNCESNVHLNSSILRFNRTSIRVRELDWKGSWPPNAGSSDFLSKPRTKYSWTLSEIKEAEDIQLLLAADVIYSDELTDLFFSVVQKLMSQGSKKILFLALEKRYNFSLDDLDVVVNGYAHFRSYLKEEEEWMKQNGTRPPCFIGKQIDLDQIPQYIREYERGKDLEIWMIKYAAQATEF